MAQRWEVEGDAMSSKTALRDEITRLHKILGEVREHLSNERFPEAREILQRAAPADAPKDQAPPKDDAERVQRFMGEFNALCREHMVPAASLIIIPNPNQAGQANIQVGGHVPTVQFIKGMMARAQEPQAPKSLLILPEGR